MAVLVAYLRLSGDNEIIALKTSGFSFYQMVLCAIRFFHRPIRALLISLGQPPGDQDL